MEPVVCGITQLVGNVDSPTLFVGDGVKLYREQIKDHLGDKAFFAQGQQIFPRASAVGTLALAKFATNDFLDPTSASPVYIRPSDAEVNLRNPQQQR
jgi:tRNA threonylcarbamoyladenosine biosynthesis protein TsaB